MSDRYDRISAERAFSKFCTPIGSRDWALFWQGWQESRMTLDDGAPPVFNTWQVMPRNATVVRDPRLDWSDSGPVEGA